MTMPGTPDPHHLHVDPEDVRKFGHRMVDIVVEHLADPGGRPVYPPPRTPAEAAALLGRTPPWEGSDPMALLERLRRDLVPASANFLHPGIMAWVAATPLPLPGLLDGLLGALRIFPHAWKLTPGSIQMELTVGRWLAQMVGFPDDAFGYVTTGGTMANLYGLAAARCDRAGWDMRERGVAGGPGLTVYASEHAHICIEQSLALLGLGTANLRRIALDEGSRLRCDLLLAAIERDRGDGLRPICVVGTAGTTPTGAVDPLDAIADVAQENGLWYHVDGSYGALAALDPRKRPLFAGLARADSLAVDPHKWLNIPFEAGCILVKDKACLERAFGCVPAYLSGGDSSAGHDHWHYGFELTRADRATKIWLALSQYGVRAFADMVSAHNDLAAGLHGLLLLDPDFEPVHVPSLSVLCFRYAPRGLPDHAVDRVNGRIEGQLNARGRVAVAGSAFRGRPVLRVCFVNHRTSWADVLAAVEEIREVGKGLADASRREAAAV
ncbi:pyridoxal phosphate-dependent decarboxylase family protein [Arenibaculum sp.]|jgi:glutamate/tyrosine decarboxylase-like PLP-dependent enzyme|uniref:pyridoxal phosphate-dependent decarboxylase family protein n=1 Tax=Arenibaculum sp. TaxID=2865862 RepID=UPI002E13818B|nr:pyridoxal-dependent decarboxylase [Arenibaculum sp.]